MTDRGSILDFLQTISSVNFNFNYLTEVLDELYSKKKQFRNTTVGIRA